MRHVVTELLQSVTWFVVAREHAVESEVGGLSDFPSTARLGVQGAFG